MDWSGRLGAGLAIVTCCLIPIAANAAVINFFDDTFNDADYVTFELSGGGSSVATTIPSGGNPGPYRQISLTVGPFQSVVNAQLFEGAQFTPATQGSVNSVDISYDVARVFTSNPGATQVARLVAVEQSGVVYTGFFGVTVSTTFEPFSSGNIVPLFPAVDWDDGPTITLGFGDSVSALGDPFTIAGGFDNFGARLDFTPLVPVIDEPVTLALLVSALAGLGVLGYRRAKRKPAGKPAGRTGGAEAHTVLECRPTVA